MEKVYTHESIVMLQTAKGLLAQNGISANIKNEHVGAGGYVGLEIFPLELWVDSAVAAKAKTLLESAFDDSTNLSEWVCPQCNEKNFSSFDGCWKCQRLRDHGSPNEL
ncbi:MAG: DUF2007 domain-containing protein [Gammaproteobacteria bacterium]